MPPIVPYEMDFLFGTFDISQRNQKAPLQALQTFPYTRESFLKHWLFGLGCILRISDNTLLPRSTILDQGDSAC